MPPMPVKRSMHGVFFFMVYTSSWIFFLKLQSAKNLQEVRPFLFQAVPPALLFHAGGFAAPPRVFFDLQSSFMRFRRTSLICNLPPCCFAAPPRVFFDLPSSSGLFCRTSSCVFRSAILLQEVLPHLLVCFSICPPLPGCFAASPELLGPRSLFRWSSDSPSSLPACLSRWSSVE
jgi:hypothetical protein